MFASDQAGALYKSLSIPGLPSKNFQKAHSEREKNALRVKKTQIIKNLYLSFENLLNDK